MKKTFLSIGIALGLGACAITQVFAQQVGTIGVGDITYSVKSKELRPKENVISAIDSGLNKALLDTRKFTVLDYDQLSKRLARSGLRLEGFYTKEYKGTEYSQAGLDYILAADVTEFGLFNKQRGKSDNVIGVIDIDFKLIGVADVTEDIVSSVSAQISKPANSDNVTNDAILDQVIEKAVDQLTDQVITGLFPIRVMEVREDSSIKLNYGEGILKAGDTVLIFPEDKNLVIGKSGKPVNDSVATLQIITAEEKFSIAQALEGFEVIEKGQQGQLLLTGG